VQSSCELIKDLFAGRAGERVGLRDNPWNRTLRKWVGQGYPVDEKGEPVSPAEHFGFDMIAVREEFDSLPIRGFEEVEEETEAWEVRRNGAGAALKWWKHRSGTPEHIDFRMTGRQVWERDYRPHLLELDRGRLDVAGARRNLARRRAQGYWTHYGDIFIWELMRRSLGDVCMYESLALDPDWIKDYNQVYTDFYKLHYGALIEEAGRPDGVWLFEDLGYRNGLFCSPAMLEELVFPYYRQLVDFFHGYGLPVVLHTCGGIEAALPLIVEAGFDGLHPMEVKAGCDVLRFADSYADKLVFIGGLDALVLESGDRELIRKETIRIIEGMKARGARYVFGSDHSLSTNVDYKDFRLAVEVYRQHAAR